MFVGLPLCKPSCCLPFRLPLTLVVLGRDPDWLDLNIHYTARVAQGTVIVRLFPTFLKPYVTACSRPN